MTGVIENVQRTGNVAGPASAGRISNNLPPLFHLLPKQHPCQCFENGRCPPAIRARIGLSRSFTKTMCVYFFFAAKFRGISLFAHGGKELLNSLRLALAAATNDGKISFPADDHFVCRPPSTTTGEVVFATL